MNSLIVLNLSIAAEALHHIRGDYEVDAVRGKVLARIEEELKKDPAPVTPTRHTINEEIPF